MGLREKARKYRQKKAEKSEVKAEETKEETGLFDFYNFIIELFTDTTLDSQINTIILSLTTQYKTEKVGINFLDEEENIYKIIGEKNLAPDEKTKLEYDFDNYFLKGIRSPIRIEDLKKDPIYQGESEKLLKMGFKVIFPLYWRNMLKGFIILGNKISGEGYTDAELYEMTKLGDLMGVALYNSAKLNSFENRLKKIEEEHKNIISLFESFKNISLSLSLEEALTMFYRIARDIYSVKTANIMLFDAVSNQFKTLKSWGFSADTDKNFIIQADEEPFNTIIELGESMTFTDLSEVPALEKIPPEDKDKIKFFMIIPIKFGDRIIGLFNIFSSAEGKGISPESEKTLTFLPFALLPYILTES